MLETDKVSINSTVGVRKSTGNPKLGKTDITNIAIFVNIGVRMTFTERELVKKAGADSGWSIVESDGSNFIRLL